MLTETPMIVRALDWRVAFGALAVAVTKAEASGDFSECRKIINSAFYAPAFLVNPRSEEAEKKED